MTTMTHPTISRSFWNGTVTFGMVNVNVKLYAATQDNDVSFKQVHAHADGTHGAVKYKRVCSECSEEVAHADISKGYDTGAGTVVVTADELAAMPLNSMKAIEVTEFVDAGDIDPIMLDRAYYLAPANDASKRAYALLRAAVAASGKVGVVKVTLRTREQLATLSVVDNGPAGTVLALTTLRWADEVRHLNVKTMDGLPEPTADELNMALTLVGMRTEPRKFAADAYQDGYRVALEALISSRGVNLIGEPEHAPIADNAVNSMMSSLLATQQRHLKVVR